eukprot:gene5265-5931_t
MAAYSAKNNIPESMSHVCVQSTKSRLKARDLSRPVVSTLDPKDHYKRPDPVQGPGIKGRIMEDNAATEKQELENEVKRLKEKLSSAEKSIKRLMKRDKDMTERLSVEVQRHVRESGKFENLSQGGGLRLTHLIERYELLYSQGRIDALDELDDNTELNKMKRNEDIKHKIMAGIMIASYRTSREYSNLIRQSVFKLLGISNNSNRQQNGTAQSQMEHSINDYLQSTTDKYNIEQIVKEVEQQLKDILPEFPDLLSQPHMASYVCECARLAWAIVNQVLPLEIEYTSERISHVMHNRFHTSDSKIQWIKLYVWPTLMNSKDKNILSKGVVIT